MVLVPDLGLDAVDVVARGEILFSTCEGIFSETLGPLQHGDLLSNRGRIVRRNQDLLSAFGVGPPDPDAGLDAVAWVCDGEVFFSTQSNRVSGTGQVLGHGDILSNQGYVFRTNRQLLQHFRGLGDRLLVSGYVDLAVTMGNLNTQSASHNSDVLIASPEHS